MRYIPRIFESDNTDYSDELGTLPDAISCKVTEERNGDFFLEMSYPAFGKGAALIKVGRIIEVKTSPYSARYQPFRIATIEKTLDGVMSITAYHISYDLDKVVVMPFEAEDLSEAFSGLEDNAYPASDFTLNAYMSSSTPFSVTVPTSLRSLLFGSEGSILDTYGGEFEFNGWEVYLRSARGKEKNISISYGKNLREFKETDENGQYDAIVPYAVFNETTYYLTDTGVCATAPVVESGTTYGYPRTIAVDLSDKFTDTAPTQAQLYAAAQSYISGHSISATANYATAYLDLSKLIGKQEQVDLCDTIYLNVQPYNLYDMKLKVVSTVYDCLLDEYESVQVGDKKVTLADTLAELMGAQK